MVEISHDKKHMRTREDPGKWSLMGVEPGSFSTLNAAVPEFVPGQTFRVPVTQSTAPDMVQPQSRDAVQPQSGDMVQPQSRDMAQPQSSDKDVAAADAASDMSERLDEMTLSVVTAAETADSQDVPAAEPDDVSENQDSAIERLHSPSDDKQCGKKRCLVVSV